MHMEVFILWGIILAAVAVIGSRAPSAKDWQKPLPSEWYSKVEAFISCNRREIFIAAFLLACFLWPIFYNEQTPDFPSYDPAR